MYSKTKCSRDHDHIAVPLDFRIVLMLQYATSQREQKRVWDDIHFQLEMVSP